MSGHDGQAIACPSFIFTGFILLKPTGIHQQSSVTSSHKRKFFNSSDPRTRNRAMYCRYFCSVGEIGKK